MNQSHALRLGDVLLAGLFLCCSLPMAGATDAPALGGPALRSVASPVATYAETYYHDYLAVRNYDHFGVTGNGGVVRPYVTAFYYPWYHRGPDRTGPWGRVTPEQVPSTITDESPFPWLNAGATRAFQAPLLGFYNDSREYIREMHLMWAKNAGIDALVVTEAGSLESVLQSTQDLNSPVKVIPMVEWASHTDTDNMENVRSNLREKLQYLYAKYQQYQNRFLTYQSKPVLYVYKRALVRVFPKDYDPTREEVRASRDAYRDAYAQVLLELARAGKEFILIADMDTAGGGAINAVSDTPGYYSLNQHISQYIAPSCKVFDGFMPYHKLFEMASALRSPEEKLGEGKTSREGLNRMEGQLAESYSKARDYLTGTGVLTVGSTRFSRSTNVKICGITVMPGFCNFTVPDIEEKNKFNIQRGNTLSTSVYQRFWNAALSTFPPGKSFPGIVGIASFNEHYEGSGIEPTVGTGSSYLDLTATNALAFKNQSSHLLDKRIYRKGSTWKMIRYGWSEGKNLPRAESNINLVNLTEVIRDLSGTFYVFDEVSVKRSYEIAAPSVEASLNPRAEGSATIKAGLNNWDSGVLLNLPKSSVPQTVIISRRTGSDDRLGVMDGTRKSSRSLLVPAMGYSFKHMLNFRSSSSDFYRGAQAIFDINYPGYSSTITVRLIPGDDRIGLANGEHVRPDQDGGSIFNGTINKNWYHRFDGRRRIEAIFGTHHLVIFLQGLSQAVIDGRCITLPESPRNINNQWYVTEDVFSPLIPEIVPGTG